MAFKYRNPEDVTSPADYVDVIEILREGSPDDNGDTSYAVARIEWEGKECIGVRWNISDKERENPEKESGDVECIGMPSSFGHPVWFVMPDELWDTESEIWKKIQASIKQRNK